MVDEHVATPNALLPYVDGVFVIDTQTTAFRRLARTDVKREGWMISLWMPQKTLLAIPRAVCRNHEESLRVEGVHLGPLLIPVEPGGLYDAERINPKIADIE